MYLVAKSRVGAESTTFIKIDDIKSLVEYEDCISVAFGDNIVNFSYMMYDISHSERIELMYYKKRKEIDEARKDKDLVKELEESAINEIKKAWNGSDTAIRLTFKKNGDFKHSDLWGHFIAAKVTNVIKSMHEEGYFFYSVTELPF